MGISSSSRKPLRLARALAWGLACLSATILPAPEALADFAGECSGCHSINTIGRRNAANRSAIIQAAIDGDAGGQMGGISNANIGPISGEIQTALNALLPVTVNTAFDTNVNVDMSSVIGLGTAFANFTTLAVVTSPGGLGAVTITPGSETFLFNPAACTTGQVNFSVKGQGPTFDSSARSVRVNVGNPTARIINTGAHPSGETGTPYSSSNSVSNGCANLATWDVSAGTFPPGLILNASNGAITGTPTSVGTFNFTMRTTASPGGATDTQAQQIVITLGLPVISNTPPAPPGMLNRSGAVGNVFAPFTIQATNPPHIGFTAAPLPAGLNLVGNVISGTPLGPAGNTDVVLQAQNATGLGPTRILRISIALNAPVITSGAPPAGTTGAPYSYQITADNGPDFFSVAAGMLPPGLTLNTGPPGTPPAGLISGTPTVPGTFNVTLRASNGAGNGDLPVTFNIALGPPVITSPGTAGGSSALPFSYMITATQSPTSFAATGLPAGLGVNTATGLISGLPTSTGTFAATISATNATATDTDPLVITIADGTPIVNSPDRASGTVGQPFSYTLTSMVNADRFDATGLPPGLTLLNSSGVISGTPTVGGVYVVNVSATNLAGTANGVLTITIAFIAPSADGLSVNVPFNTPTLITLPVTGAFTGIRIVQAPAHGTLSTPVPNNFTLTYTPASGYSGNDTFTYFATGPGGNSPTVTVNITVGTSAPVALLASMTVPLNTATTLDLSAFVSGSSVTGVAIVTEPKHGTAEVNGMKVTYTPKRDFFGSDAFTYKAFGNAGSSTPAIVSVTVIGRPDPSKDPNVVGLIDAQVQTSRRFSRAQIGNYQRRMESLHVFGAGVVDSEAKPAKTSAAIPKPAAFVDKPALAPAKPAEPAAAAKPADPLASSLTGALAGFATSGSLNIEASREGRDASVWIAGVANFGNREGSDESAGARFSTDGLSVGADKRFSDRLALGMGVGYARDRTDIGSDGTKTKSSGTSIAGYGSFHPSRDTYIDALLGYGKLDFDTDRWVVAADEFATGRRKGDQVFGSVAGGYEYRKGTMLISPYGRFDFSVDKLKQSSESGAGLAALTYFDHKQKTTSLSAGLRVESQHETDFGAAQPRVRAEYRRDFEDSRSASIAYADLFSGPTYSVTPVGTSRNSLLLGMGVDFLFRKGLRIGIDYQGERSSGSQNVQAVRFLVSQDLDFKGSPSWGWGTMPFENPIRVEAGVTYDDNVSRGRLDNEILSDRSYSLSVGLDKEYKLGRNFRAVVTPLFTGEEFRRYSGLGRFSAGLQGEMQYRGTSDFDATTLAIVGRAVYDKYESNIRTGERYYVGLNARKSLTDRIDIFGEIGRNVRYGESAVFELKDYSARFNFDYSLGRNGSLYFSGEYRKGDIFSSGRGSLVNLALADVFVADDAFEDGFFAYRFEGKTALGTIGYNYPLGPRDSLDFSWRYIQSKPDKSPSFDSGESLRYKINQYSVIYLIRF